MHWGDVVVAEPRKWRNHGSYGPRDSHAQVENSAELGDTKFFFK
jgi:hypothetical protein